MGGFWTTALKIVRFELQMVDGSKTAERKKQKLDKRRFSIYYLVLVIKQCHVFKLLFTNYQFTIQHIKSPFGKPTMKVSFNIKFRAI